MRAIRIKTMFLPKYTIGSECKWWQLTFDLASLIKIRINNNNNNNEYTSNIFLLCILLFFTFICSALLCCIVPMIIIDVCGIRFFFLEMGLWWVLIDECPAGFHQARRSPPHSRGASFALLLGRILLSEWSQEQSKHLSSPTQESLFPDSYSFLVINSPPFLIKSSRFLFLFPFLFTLPFPIGPRLRRDAQLQRQQPHQHHHQPLVHLQRHGQSWARLWCLPSGLHT